MPKIRFTQNLQRHIAAPAVDSDGATVSEALHAVFGRHPQLRGYVLDDQGRLRKHVSIFVGGEMIRDRKSLSDPVEPDAEIFVMQALSGG